MSALRLILGDQLSASLASLKEADKGSDILLMVEVDDEASYVRHHKVKIAFLFSAMRHFAEEMRSHGWQVDYIAIDDPDNSHSFDGEVKRALTRHRPGRLVCTYPGEYRVAEMMQNWRDELDIAVELLEDNRFICTQERFHQWADGRKQLRMEYFYREMRRENQILMQDNEPVGGQWNYDAENRAPPKEGLDIPAPTGFEPDAITRDVLALVENRFAAHFGSLAHFHYATSRDQVLEVLDAFIEQRLGHFGTYQDAMIEGEPWMYHAHIGLYLNCGLLLPMEAIRAAERAYFEGKAPLNAVEGFIRQILGWREYVRGLYWLEMPAYKRLNYLEAKRPLPDFFWTAKTQMNCLKQAITQTRDFAYAHHIQRLMVLGNFALLAGLHPDEVNEWYLVVYADAYEWVELPNVSGMVLYADGGRLASKPYAAGGAYIDRMSDYCKNCRYKVKQKNGPDACPFNYLYWDFLARHQDKFKSNARMGMMYRSYAKMSDEKKQAISADANRFFEKLDSPSEMP